MVDGEEPPAEDVPEPPPFGSCILSVAASEWGAPSEPPALLHVPVTSAGTVSLTLTRNATYLISCLSMLPEASRERRWRWRRRLVRLLPTSRSTARKVYVPSAEEYAEPAAEGEEGKQARRVVKRRRPRSRPRRPSRLLPCHAFIL